MPVKRRKPLLATIATVSAAAALAAFAAGCGGGDSSEASATAEAQPSVETTTEAATTSAPATDAADTGAAGEAEPDLLSACGEKIVVQTDWFPSPEHGAMYQLAGTDGTFDKEKGRYTGEIGDTGVLLEVRAGGPFTGFEEPVSQMYQDPDITMGYVSTDEGVRHSKELPTVAIVAPLEKDPQILMWDPEVYDFKSFADIGKSGATVLVFEGGTYVDYLIGKGLLTRDQVDGSYDGSPTRFVTEGDIVQQGFATNEPYLYENEIEEWMKPVDFLLIADSGFDRYPQSIATRPETLEEKRDCFKLLVPMIQQAEVDYITNPKPTLDKIIEIVVEMDTFWQISPELGAHNVASQLELGIVANGSDQTLGNFDEQRLNDFIEILEPIYAEQGVELPADLSPTSIATNEFIDPSIGL